MTPADVSLHHGHSGVHAEGHPGGPEFHRSHEEGGHPSAGPANPNHAKMVAFGMNHRTAPLALREKIAIPAGEIAEILKGLHSLKQVREVVAVSTCNRVELYAALDSSDGAFDHLVHSFCAARHVPPGEAEPFLTRFSGFEVAKHLFEVTSGLDSMVPGENEVLAQVKGAYAAAVEAGTAGSFMGRLFQHSFKVAKEVRTTTGISRRKVSLATVVVELTRKIFGNVKSVKLLLAGTGKMGSLALNALVSDGAKVTVIANRSLESAKKLADCHGCKAVALDEAGKYLAHTDVYVGATASSTSVLHVSTVEESLKGRNGRPLLLVDLSVPRNIDPAVGSLSGAILCNIDDLQGIVNSNVSYRLEQAGQAGELIDKAVVEFSSIMRMDRISDTVTKLCESLEEIGASEFRKAVPKLGSLTASQKAEVEKMVQRVVGKILHLPLRAIRGEAQSGKVKEMEAAVRKIFGI